MKDLLAKKLTQYLISFSWKTIKRKYLSMTESKIKFNQKLASK